jgi:hypothetical protein
MMTAVVVLGAVPRLYQCKAASKDRRVMSLIFPQEPFSIGMSSYIDDGIPLSLIGG